MGKKTLPYFGKIEVLQIYFRNGDFFWGVNGYYKKKSVWPRTYFYVICLLLDINHSEIRWVSQTHTLHFLVFCYWLHFFPWHYDFSKTTVFCIGLFGFLLFLMYLSTGYTCEQPYVPVNANFSCIKEEKGVNCTLVCKEGYSLTQNAVHSYFCPNNGQWEPSRAPDRPDCSREYPASENSFNFSA